MSDAIRAQSTESLLAITRNDSNTDVIYTATQELLKRWRKGADLEALEALLRSEICRDRIYGAYYLGELGETVDGLKTSVIELADDPLSDCRREFVKYMTITGYYDEKIAQSLAKCFFDYDLVVRMTAIKWAISTSDETFQDFYGLIESGVGHREPRFRNALSNDFWNESFQKRAVRGLNIIRRLRDGEEIQQIRQDITEEDSFVFDAILFSKTFRRRRDRSHQ